MVELKRSQVLYDTITRLSRRGAHSNIRRLFLKSHPVEIAEVIRRVSEEEGVNFIAEIRHGANEPATFSELGGSFLAIY